MAGTEDSKTHSLNTEKSKRQKTEEGADTSLESSRFARKNLQAEGHSSSSPRKTEGKQTHGGIWDDHGHNCDVKSTSCGHESDHSGGTSSKKGRSFHHGKGEACHEFRNISQASSSRSSEKRTSKFKGSSGCSRNEKGKCRMNESHSGDVVGTGRYRTGHDRKKLNIQDSKWDRNRQGGIKNKQKHMANKCTRESEPFPWNKRLGTRKENKHQSKSHKRDNFSKIPVEGNKKKTDKRKEGADKRKEGERGSEHKETSVVSPNQPGTNSSGVREIPGFYYDIEKKKYFRILPGHFHSNSWITSKTIKEKNEDETRKKLFKQENQPKTKNRKSISPVSILQSMQRGDLTTGQYFRSSIECRVRAMSVLPSANFQPSTDLQVSGRVFQTKFLQLDRSQSKILVVLESEQISRILLGSVSVKKGSSKEFQLNSWHDVHIRTDFRSQISSASLVDISQQDSSSPGNLYVLFSWSGDDRNGVQLVKCPSDDYEGSRIGYRFESPGEIIRSCSWCSNPQYPAFVCIGFCDKAEVIDTLSTSRQILDTKKSEVYSQVFAREQPLIYLGTKRGDIMTYDLRIHPSSFLMSFEESSNHLASVYHGKGVCSLRLLKNESYLLAGSFSGLIKLWDLRKRAVVKEIHGHENNYKQLPVEIDDSENFVYAVGQDKLTRIWSLKDCSHLKTIPYPYPLKDCPPVAAVSLNWGDKGLPGLMTGANGKLTWYPF